MQQKDIDVHRIIGSGRKIWNQIGNDEWKDNQDGGITELQKALCAGIHSRGYTGIDEYVQYFHEYLNNQVFWRKLKNLKYRLFLRG